MNYNSCRYTHILFFFLNDIAECFVGFYSYYYPNNIHFFFALVFYIKITDDVIIKIKKTNGHALYESIRKSFTRDPFEHYVIGICGLFICILGIVSNALSFSILIRRTMQLSTYVYLAGLCLSDFTTCLFLIPGYILDALPIQIPDSELPRTYAYTQLLIITGRINKFDLYEILFFYLGAISTTARVLSVWLCVAFTIDRWIS